MSDVGKELLCPLCLRPKPDEGECPHCRWPGDVLRWSPHVLPPGTLLAGRYRTGRVLGQGGFALTYLALDQSLEIRLCVKEYFPANLALRSAEDGSVLLKDPDEVEAFNEGKTRFLHEARILARFEGHPGIVPVRDVFEERGTVYIVTGYLEGVTLKQFLTERGGSIPPERALPIFMPVMDSLRAVHEAGVVHRDVSPENIFLTTEGQVKLLDFGSALTMDGADRGFTVVVKPGYAPAEQYEAQGDQGPWTDVYGLAASLYRALTGQLPPTGPDRVAGQPLKAPSALGVALSPPREAVLLKALSLEPHDRYDDVGAFQKALLEAEDGAERRHGGNGGLLAAGLLLFVGLAFGGWWGWNGLSPRRLEERGRSLIVEGEPERALPLLERALIRSAEPGATLYLALAEAQVASGRPQEGLASLARLERLGGLPPEGLLLAAEAHEQLGEEDKALAFFREAARIIGDDVSLWLRAARSAVAAKRFDAADEAWSKALALDPTLSEALDGLAAVAEERGRLDEAIRLRRRLAEEGSSAEAWRSLAVLLERRGDEKALLEVWKKVVHLEPDKSQGWKNLGMILLRQGHPDEAAGAFRRQVDLAGDDGEAWRDLGLALLQAGKAGEAAEALYRASALRSGDKVVWEGLGRAWKALGRLRDAEGAYRRALEIDAEKSDWHYELGLALLGQNRFPEAVEALQRAVEGGGTTPSYRLALARALTGAGRDGEARSLLEEQMKASPSLEGWLLLAHLQERRGAHREAAVAFEAARRLDPKAVKPLLGLGRSHIAAKEPAMALPVLLEALRLSPEEGEAMVNAGRACLALKRYDQALTYLKEYLGLHPEDEEGWRLLGEVYFHLGGVDPERNHSLPAVSEKEPLPEEPSSGEERLPEAVPPPMPLPSGDLPASEGLVVSEDLVGSPGKAASEEKSPPQKVPEPIPLPGKDRTLTGS